jgi:hypothetical protein
MQIDSAAAKRLNELAQNALAFFEEAWNKASNAWRMSEWTWGRLSRDQKATAERLGRELRQKLAAAGARDPKCAFAGQAGLGALREACSNIGRRIAIPIVSHVPRGGSAGIPRIPGCI